MSNRLRAFDIKFETQLKLDSTRRSFAPIIESKENISKRVQRSYTISEKLNAVKRVKEHSGNLSAATRDLEIVNFVTKVVATSNKETIRRAFECCGIAPRGRTVEDSLLNSGLQDILSGLEVNVPDAHNDKIEEDEIQVNEIRSDVNYGQATN
ncbi:Hypothetical predicted protein [Octopus vulgaris]|uniref:Uncharacterized protein n=1 Tax=Octopus vulgaris TaxID=6645 RepID=A0AA36AK23_OCTVU|nr:Hypothetical predicted protein [Octopus vulgaris]